MEAWTRVEAVELDRSGKFKQYSEIEVEELGDDMDEGK